MNRFVRRVLLLIAALAAVGFSGSAQTVPFDAVYSGTAGWHVLFWPRSSFSATGEDSTASSGLTSARFYSEGFVNVFGNLEYGQAGDLGGISLYGSNGDVLAALYTLSAKGSAYRYGGSFTVTQGAGRFAGATGKGTFLLEAGEYMPNQYGGYVAPATLTIHGNVNAPAIPEPGTAALLACPLLTAAGRALTRIRRAIKLCGNKLRMPPKTCGIRESHPYGVAYQA